MKRYTMNRIDDAFGFYAILTDPQRGYDYLTNLLVEYEIPFVQLREKHLPDFEILKIAELMRKITEKSNTKLIINDSVQIMLDSDADGVHLGQGDMPIAEARDICGDERIIGWSTHNPDETKASTELPIDYIGIGPVYKTPTKDIPDPVLGLETMKEMVSIATVPAVCIGGISVDRIETVLGGGARNFSLVRPLCATDNPEKALKEILEIQAPFIGQ